MTLSFLSRSKLRLTPCLPYTTGSTCAQEIRWLKWGALGSVGFLIRRNNFRKIAFISKTYNMPPDEVAKISRFRELNEAQKKLMLSARKESGKFTEGVILSKSTEVLFRAVPPSLYLAMAMTEPEEKAERFRVMGELGVGELDAAIEIGRRIDRLRGI